MSCVLYLLNLFISAIFILYYNTIFISTTYILRGRYYAHVSNYRHPCLFLSNNYIEN